MRIFILLIGLVTTLVQAQTCQGNISQTSPTDSFILESSGTATDTRTGLEWMRCSLGQFWNGATCEGDPSQLNWQQALNLAHGFEFANKSGWRLPNLKELASITERSCVRPSINATLFPNTAEDDYWTSTPTMTDPQRAWVVAFFNSSNSVKQKQLFVFARLVRNAD